MSAGAIPERSRRLVKERSHGHCEGCGGVGVHWHHRRSRSIVDEFTHCPSNAMWLCSTCHNRAHANPEWARGMGWIVRRHVHIPGLVPVNTYAGRYMFDTQGNAYPVQKLNQPIEEEVPTNE